MELNARPAHRGIPAHLAGLASRAHLSAVPAHTRQGRNASRTIHPTLPKGENLMRHFVPFVFVLFLFALAPPGPAWAQPLKNITILKQYENRFATTAVNAYLDFPTTTISGAAEATV